MNSVQKSVTIPATIRVSARHRSSNAANYYDADITKVTVGDGVTNIFKHTPRLVLNPDAGFEDLFLSIKNARVVMNTTTTGSITGASEPSGPYHSFSDAAVSVTRLDTSELDSQATIEFRVPVDSNLPQIASQDVVYSRAYLMATLYRQQYQTKPALSNTGKPAVVVSNTGAETFDDITDLYLIPNNNGVPITVGGGITEKTSITAEADTAGSLLGKHFTLSSLSSNYYVWFREMIAAVPEVTDIDCEADTSSSLNNKYWIFNTPTDGYFVWYNVNSAGVAPVVAGRTAVAVAISANATAATVASATASAIDALASMVATSSSGTVTMTNVAGGETTNAADGDTGWTTAWTVTVSGANVSYTADPAIVSKTGIPVTIVQGDSATAVATAARLAIDDTVDFSSAGSGDVVTITNIQAGNVTDATVGNTGWTTITITEQGSLAAGDSLFIDSRVLVGDATYSEDVVLAIVEFRIAPADDISNDIMTGTTTTQCEMVFRLVI